MEIFEEIELHLIYDGGMFTQERVFVVEDVDAGIKKAKEMFEEHRFQCFYFSKRFYLVYLGKRYYEEEEETSPEKDYLIIEKFLDRNDVVELNNITLLSNMDRNDWKYCVQTVTGGYYPYSPGETVYLDKNFNTMEIPCYIAK